MTHTYPDLLALAATCPAYTAGSGARAATPVADGAAPTAAAGAQAEGPVGDPAPADLFDHRLAEALCLDVLGERENGNVVLFASHPERRKTVEIRDCDRLSYARLLQIAGPPVLACVDEGGGEDVYSKFSLTQVRNTLCSLAGARRLGDEALVGPGCWQPLDEHGDDLAGVLLVGAGEAAHWDGERLHRITTPRACGRLLDLSTSQPWYDFDELASRLADYAPAWGIGVVDEAAALFARWRWKQPKIHPETLVGLVLASWVQTLWPWRPHVAIVGASKAGKSLLMETMEDLFCGLALRSSESTAAGVRQDIQKSASMVFLDEFQRSKERPRILQMARASSRGDRVLRGTTGQRRVASLLRHIFWVATTEAGLKKAPDLNRFITLELLLPEEEQRGKLFKRPSSELHDLGIKLLVTALRSITPARPLALRLKAAKVKGVDSRVIESYAVPAAILASAIGCEKDAVGLLENLLVSHREQTDEDPSDELELIRDIAMADMRGDKGVTVTVAVALGNYAVDNADLLGRHGITFAADRRGPKDAEEAEYVFFDHRAVAAKLLRGTDWQGQCIDTHLARLEGARKSRRTVGGRLARGILVPWAWLRANVIDTGGLLTEDRTPQQEGF